MSATASLRGRPARALVPAAGRPLAVVARVLGPVAIVAVAAALRLVGLGRTPVNPFYDAAVRSMGESWHAFLTGAIDPTARVAIDKPPVDLWLQVASTKLLGFTPSALLLPAALGGIAAVVALYDLVRTVAGRTAAAAAALALAVLPVAVITARGDTMDAVMAACVLAAFAVAARGLAGARAGHMVAAGALLGLAFEVKLFEALVAAPALAVLWWLGARADRRHRALTLGAAAGACAAVAVLWLVVVSVAVPAAQRPFAFGSTHGSAWESTFVYDGWDRLTARDHPPLPAVLRRQGPGGATVQARRHAALRTGLRRREALQRAAPAPPGPARLLSSRAHLGARVGVELAAAWIALLGALLCGAWRRLDRTGRAGLAALAVWLATGTVLFSLQGALRPRYLEAFGGAVAGTLGVGVWAAAAALRSRPRLWPARVPIAAGAVVLLAAVLLPSALTSAAAVRAHVQDSGTPGAIPPARLARLSAYLRDHQGGARYEAAAVSVSKGAALIAHDGRPVLLLDGANGRPLVPVGALARAVARGEVRYALVGSDCSLAAADPRAGCSPAARWIRATGTDVSRAAGQPQPGLLYRLTPGGG